MSDSITSVTTGEETDVLKQQIRCLIANVYDLQKLRISAGNRLVQSFYLQLGIAPSTSPDNADKEEKKMIDRLKTEYSRITDAVAENNKSIKANIKALKESDEDAKKLKLVNSVSELRNRLM